MEDPPQGENAAADANVPDDVLRKLLSYLPTEALLTRAAAVCRRWRRVVHDPDRPLWRDTFAKTWGLREVSGRPRTLAFCAHATVRNFVVEHSLERGDTVASIAVRHGMSLGEVKRANGLLSEHALQTRTSYLVPVRDTSRLADAQVHIHVDAATNREIARVLPIDALRDDFIRRAPVPIDPQDAARLSATMVEALAKTIGQDTDTARFYMQEAGGDIRRAHMAFMSDKEWSQRNPTGRNLSALGGQHSPPVSGRGILLHGRKRDILCPGGNTFS